jgi:chromosome segregation ATPase
MNLLQRSAQSTHQAGIATVNGGDSFQVRETVRVVESLSPAQAQGKFNAVVVGANDLIRSNKEARLAICRDMRNNIDSLINYTDIAIRQKESSESKLIKEFDQAHSNSVHVANQIRTCKSSLDNLNAQLANTKSRLNDLNDQCNNLSKDIENARRQIKEEEQKRKNAALDTLIPLYGLIDGIIKKQPMRGIPGYSAVRGINSAVHRDKEACENRLSEKQREMAAVGAGIEQISKQKEQEEGRKSRDDGELSRLQSREKSLDQEIKKYGKDLTELRNILFSLKEIMAKYHFLKMDVDIIEDCSEANLLDASTISSFVSQITQARTTFLQITGF